MPLMKLRKRQLHISAARLVSRKVLVLSSPLVVFVARTTQASMSHDYFTDSESCDDGEFSLPRVIGDDFEVSSPSESLPPHGVEITAIHYISQQEYLLVGGKLLHAFSTGSNYIMSHKNEIRVNDNQFRKSTFPARAFIQLYDEDELSESTNFAMLWKAHQDASVQAISSQPQNQTENVVYILMHSFEDAASAVIVTNLGISESETVDLTWKSLITYPVPQIQPTASKEPYRLHMQACTGGSSQESYQILALGTKHEFYLKIMSKNSENYFALVQDSAIETDGSNLLHLEILLDSQRENCAPTMYLSNFTDNSKLNKYQLHYTDSSTPPILKLMTRFEGLTTANMRFKGIVMRQDACSELLLIRQQVDDSFFKVDDFIRNKAYGLQLQGQLTAAKRSLVAMNCTSNVSMDHYCSMLIQIDDTLSQSSKQSWLYLSLYVPIDASDDVKIQKAKLIPELLNNRFGQIQSMKYNEIFIGEGFFEEDEDIQSPNVYFATNFKDPNLNPERNLSIIGKIGPEETCVRVLDSQFQDDFSDASLSEESGIKSKIIVADGNLESLYSGLPFVTTEVDISEQFNPMSSIDAQSPKTQVDCDSKSSKNNCSEMEMYWFYLKCLELEMDETHEFTIDPNQPPQLFEVRLQIERSDIPGCDDIDEYKDAFFDLYFKEKGSFTKVGIPTFNFQKPGSQEIDCEAFESLQACLAFQIYQEILMNKPPPDKEIPGKFIMSFRTNNEKLDGFELYLEARVVQARDEQIVTKTTLLRFKKKAENSISLVLDSKSNNFSVKVGDKITVPFTVLPEDIDFQDVKIEAEYINSACLPSLTPCPVTVDLANKEIKIEASDKMFAKDSVFQSLIEKSQKETYSTVTIGDLVYEEERVETLQSFIVEVNIKAEDKGSSFINESKHRIAVQVRNKPEIEVTRELIEDEENYTPPEEDGDDENYKPPEEDGEDSSELECDESVETKSICDYIDDIIKDDEKRKKDEKDEERKDQSDEREENEFDPNDDRWEKNDESSDSETDEDKPKDHEHHRREHDIFDPDHPRDESDFEPSPRPGEHERSDDSHSDNSEEEKKPRDDTDQSGDDRNEDRFEQDKGPPKQPKRRDEKPQKEPKEEFKEKAEKKITAPGKVLEVDEDTIDEEIQKYEFDIFKFIKNNEQKTQTKQIPKEMPEILKIQELEKDYLLINAGEITSYGRLAMSFSSQIDDPVFSEIFMEFEQAGFFGDSFKNRGIDWLQKQRVLQDGQDESSQEIDQQANLISIEKLLYATDSIKFTLVPGQIADLDRKEFEWKLEKFDKNGMDISFIFDQAEYISSNALDTMNVEFRNQAYYLKQKDSNKAIIPDGYQLMRPIPRQEGQLLSQEQAIQMTINSQIFVVANFGLSFALSTAIQTLFDSIMIYQLLAHFPLANVQLPANCMQVFSILISVVSFDYFPLTDLVDFGFTETEPWNIRFSWLGYETTNFVEGMGSLIVFASIGVVYALFVVLMSRQVCVRRCKSSKLKHCCSLRTVFQKWLLFMQGTVFTMLICIIINWRSLEIYDYLNSADHVSIIISFVALATILVFFILVLVFTFKTARAIVLVYQADHKDKNQHTIEVVRSQYKVTLKARHQFTSRRATIERIASLEADQIIAGAKQEQQLLRERADLQTGRLDKFKAFLPFMDGFRRSSAWCLIYELQLNVRRIILLFAAMYLTEHAYAQATLFMLTSLLGLVYLASAKPFEERSVNWLNIFNEVCLLMASYYIICIMAFSDVDNEIGLFLTYTIWGSVIVNGLIIAYQTLREAFLKVKHLIIQKCCRQLSNNSKEKGQIELISSSQQKRLSQSMPCAILEIVPSGQLPPIMESIKEENEGEQEEMESSNIALNSSKKRNALKLASPYRKDSMFASDDIVKNQNQNQLLGYNCDAISEEQESPKENQSSRMLICREGDSQERVNDTEDLMQLRNIPIMVIDTEKDKRAKTIKSPVKINDPEPEQIVSELLLIKPKSHQIRSNSGCALRLVQKESRDSMAADAHQMRNIVLLKPTSGETRQNYLESNITESDDSRNKSSRASNIRLDSVKNHQVVQAQKEKPKLSIQYVPSEGSIQEMEIDIQLSDHQRMSQDEESLHEQRRSHQQILHQDLQMTVKSQSYNSVLSENDRKNK